ncbi:MAG: AMP-binding protein [Bryobacterales bacterium]|nr:AMP-binding protein [Bryobacterales bacterium]
MSAFPSDSPDRIPAVLDELRLLAVETPQAAALLAPGRQPLTFAGLWSQIETFGQALRGAGVGRDDVVALVMRDSPEFISSFLAIASVAICAPLNPGLRASELKPCLEGLPARYVLLDPTLNTPAEAVARALEIRLLHALPTLGREAGIVNMRDFGNGEPAAPSHPMPEHTALLLFTSATTGTARLVPLTHRNLSAMAVNSRAPLNLTASDRFLSMMPLFHLQGLMAAVAQLAVGGSVVCLPGFDAARFLSQLEEFRPTWYTAGPALHGAILPVIQSRPDVLRRCPLRFVRSIGAALPRGLQDRLEAALQAPVLEGYGMTETGLITSNRPSPDGMRRGSVGRSAGVEIGIMSPAGDFLPPGEEGEIVVRGPTVIQGYRHNPEANRLAFRDGWLRTGDVGRMDADGFLFFTGRIKEIINRGGEKILPLEVDEALFAHAAVADAATFGVPHPSLGEDVMAAVVLRPGASATEAELRRFVAARLAGFKVPRRIVFLDAIPKGATGKPRRAFLAQQVLAAAGGETAGSAEDSGSGSTRDAGLWAGPSSPIEKRLAAIWKRILHVERVGIRDDFFSLGGDSFSLTLLVTELETEFGRDRHLLDGPEFFSSPTIETLACLLGDGVARGETAQRGEDARFITLQRHGSRIPFFCFPGADENPYYFVALSRHLGQDQPFYVARDPQPPGERGVYTVEEAAERFRASLQTVQPRGPYILGGHCYGGMLAFEIARRLAARGEEVRMLVLCEVPAPGYPKVVRHWKSYLRQAGLQVSAALRGDAHVSPGEVAAHLKLLAGLFRKRSGAAARRLLARLRLRMVIDSVEQIGMRNKQAARSYVPRPFACKVVQFIAAGEHHSTVILDDPRLGWRDLTAGEFLVREVPGRADAIFKEPAVADLARQIRGLLDAANRPPAAASLTGFSGAAAASRAGR